eukprot:3357513-Prymnesium_polylepis.1
MRRHEQSARTHLGTGRIVDNGHTHALVVVREAASTQAQQQVTLRRARHRCRRGDAQADRDARRAAREPILVRGRADRSHVHCRGVRARPLGARLALVPLGVVRRLARRQRVVDRAVAVLADRAQH